MSQMLRSFEANSWTLEQKGSEDLAKSSALAGDQSYLGQAPNAGWFGEGRMTR